ncbi:MAG: glucose-1-phosphate thymidylyltransferase, partial [Deinococcus sp.]|nr:glucose-1-phosphate thymidylyltransferase [Deinococcus sp.]
FTSIGRETVIRRAEIEHSSIDSGALIENVPTRLQDCLIGVKASVKGGRTVPRSHKLTISDASVVELA